MLRQLPQAEFEPEHHSAIENAVLQTMSSMSSHLNTFSEDNHIDTLQLIWRLLRPMPPLR